MNDELEDQVEEGVREFAGGLLIFLLGGLVVCAGVLVYIKVA